MPNPFIKRADAIGASVEKLRRHVANYAAGNPNDDMSQAILARMEIKQLQEKLADLERILKNALSAK